MTMKDNGKRIIKVAAAGLLGSGLLIGSHELGRQTGSALGMRKATAAEQQVRQVRNSAQRLAARNEILLRIVSAEAAKNPAFRKRLQRKLPRFFR